MYDNCAFIWFGCFSIFIKNKKYDNLCTIYYKYIFVVCYCRNLGASKLHAKKKKIVKDYF